MKVKKRQDEGTVVFNGTRFSRLDLQAKLLLVLVGVISGTFLLLLLAESHFTRPLLEDEIRQSGVNLSKGIAAQIVGSRILTRAKPANAIEDLIRSSIYSNPNVMQIDVAVLEPSNPTVGTSTGSPKILFTVSSVEEEPGTLIKPPVIQEQVLATRGEDDQGDPVWTVTAPILVSKKVVGAVQVVESVKLIEKVISILWWLKVIGAVVSVVVLTGALSIILRRMIFTDRKLKKAEVQNIQLETQLHEAQRVLIQNEKLAVMGQLTGSFAHEIGTPLNAIGGHLQLLSEDLKETANTKILDRVKIIENQVIRIGEIVRNFLQTTAKPPAQVQLIDANQVIQKVVLVFKPRFETLRVDTSFGLDRSLPPIRMAPLELEQVLINLFSNALDSLSEKSHPRRLVVSTVVERRDEGLFVVIKVWDSGIGIKKDDLIKVKTPFFTTKPPGVGTGLGLAICQELVQKVHGNLKISSREGAWAEVQVEIPTLAQ